MAMALDSNIILLAPFLQENCTFQREASRLYAALAVGIVRRQQFGGQEEWA
jgi:hypothetical protein